MKNLFAKILASSFLLLMTITAYGACFHGWFLPDPLKKPVSLRDGSTRARSHGRGFYFIGAGRSHYGGGYRGGQVTRTPWHKCAGAIKTGTASLIRHRTSAVEY